MDTKQGSPEPEPRPDGEEGPGPKITHAAGEGPWDAEAASLRAAEAAAAAHAARVAALRAAETVGGMAHTGLRYWAALVFVGGLGCVLLGRAEAAALLALAALFALAQSWDARDAARTGDFHTDVPLQPGEVGQALRWGVPLVVPFVGALAYAALGITAQALGSEPRHVLAARWCFAAAGVCLALAVPQVRHALARVVVPHSPATHTARLTASLALLVLMLPVPFRLLAVEFLAQFTEGGRPLVEMGSLFAQLAGEVVFALAAVGLWVKRGVRATGERLGIGRLGGRECLVALVGLVAVVAVNGGMEWLERERFHDLWLADQAMGKLMVGQISVMGALALGICAGVGEEVLVRGALQPRAGLVWAAVLFSAGHVQYTWFGMLTILLLGLTLGLVRRLSNTSAAIAVHVIYDIVAVLGTPR